MVFNSAYRTVRKKKQTYEKYETYTLFCFHSSFVCSFFSSSSLRFIVIFSCSRTSHNKILIQVFIYFFLMFFSICFVYISCIPLIVFMIELQMNKMDVNKIGRCDNSGAMAGVCVWRILLTASGGIGNEMDLVFCTKYEKFHCPKIKEEENVINRF